MTREPEVSLRAIKAETVRAICALDVRPEQRSYVETGEVEDGEVVIRLAL